MSIRRKTELRLRSGRDASVRHLESPRDEKLAADDRFHAVGRFLAAFLLDVTPDGYKVAGSWGAIV